LDPKGREDMLAMVRRIAEELGSSVLLCSHLLMDVERTCDHVIMLNRGKALRSGRIEDGFLSMSRTWWPFSISSRAIERPTAPAPAMSSTAFTICTQVVPFIPPISTYTIMSTPTMAITSCTRTNAISYKTITGDAYFGGSLSAGVLKNAVTSSLTTANASLELGPFGTTGNPKSVVAS
jgi:energy-coupling factor transporter ATP-binding protein EcfA2